MRRTLYGVLEDTRVAATALRVQTPMLDPGISDKLARFEAAVDHALASSPDGTTVAQPEELVALDALCDLHLALQHHDEPLKERLRPIVDEWIAYAASTGLTPQELARSAGQESRTEMDGWLQSLD